MFWVGLLEYIEKQFGLLSMIFSIGSLLACHFIVSQVNVCKCMACSSPSTKGQSLLLYYFDNVFLSAVFCV